MNLFGIGIPEILFILFLALLLFGPKDLEKTGRILGRGLNKVVRSDIWRTIQQTSREIRTLPNRLMRETGLDELQKSAGKDLRGSMPEIHKVDPGQQEK